MRKTIAAVLVLLCLGAYGCGDGTDEYVDRINERQDEAGRTIVEAGRAVTATSSQSADADAIGDQRVALESLADEIQGAAEVPESLADENRNLALAVDDLAATVGRASEATDPDAYRLELKAATQRVQEAIASVNREVAR